MFMIIKQKFLTYQTRMRKEAFDRWRRETKFVSTAAKNLTITANSLIISQQEKIQNLRLVLQKRQQELDQLQSQHKNLESKGKVDFSEKVRILNRLVKRQAINKFSNIIKTKVLKSPFQMIKACSEYKFYKNKMLRDLPKPRKKQWWEKLMEEEYNYFYEQAGEKLKRVPLVYRDIYDFILEHRLIKHVIVIQRFIRKRKMRQWLNEHEIDQQQKHPQQAQQTKLQRQNQPRKVKVDVSFLELKGNKERGELECSIF
ncbi:UNKNOWN [Stylonychia lemnae]|uniref:Uncharacterized protein n=1 Tax=Stylonychia lemnae TaxID=5949 RepID=A0A078AFD8_STYLE|nr:UNKNOWN [Stylonychia lemnae]|eukprot:CDW79638.1 UNKNOWN [Stylonychia lemnae]